MNQDNTRLKEIQQLKNAYKFLMIKAETDEEAFEHQEKYRALEKEEKEILKRCDVL